MFSKISKNLLNISYFRFKNTPILDHLSENFLAVAGVEEENSGTSMLLASAIL